MRQAVSPVSTPGVHSIILECRSSSICEVELSSDANLTVRSGPPPRITQTDSTTQWHISLDPGETSLAFWARGGQSIALSASSSGNPIQSTSQGASPTVQGRIDRLFLIPVALLVQIVPIALPEEFFYRGYLQQRMTEVDSSWLQRRYRWVFCTPVGQLSLLAQLLLSATLPLGSIRCD